jgi:hypothetical protein
MATDQARLAVDTRAFPLLIYDPRKGDTIRQRLSLQGNPAVNDDWWINPKTSEQVDFIDFARSEGRFSKHFDKDGNPSHTLLQARQERLENWHVLQELAGVLKEPGAQPKTAAKQAPAKPAAGDGNGQGKPAPSLPPGYAAGSKIRYHDGENWIGGVLRSTSPVVLELDDQSEISVSEKVLREAVAVGIVALLK